MGKRVSASFENAEDLFGHGDAVTIAARIENTLRGVQAKVTGECPCF